MTHDKGVSYRDEVRERARAVFALGPKTPVRYRLRGRIGRRGDTYADVVELRGDLVIVRPWGRELLRRFSLARVAIADVASVPTRAEYERILAAQRAWGFP